MTTLFKPIRPKKISEEIVEQIIQHISQGQLKPGERIPSERDLASALGVTAFFGLNGITFITHLHIVYADLAFTYFALGALGLIYLWLKDIAPPRTLPLAALFFAGLPWSKFEGAPLAGTILLAAGLTLLWLRPQGLLGKA